MTLQNIVLGNIVVLWLFSLVNLLLILAVIRRVNTTRSSLFASAPFIAGGLEIGSRAPNFKSRTLTGENVTMDDFRNRKLSLIFISPGCQSCRDNLSMLESLMPLATKLEITPYLVSLGEMEATQEMIQESNTSIPTLISTNNFDFESEYKVVYTPSFYQVDSQGNISASGAPDIQSLTAVWTSYS